MENNNELLQEIIKTGIDEFKKDKETESIVSETEDSLLEQKKAIVKKYIDKKINDPILQLT